VIDPNAPPDPDALLSIRGLVKYFPLTRGVLFRKKIGDVKAVDGVNFDLRPGETLGLVGESGCGKSTVARVILRLYVPTAGQAYYKGQDIFTLRRKEMRQLRRQIQIIFQDPYSSLNPRMTVGDIVAEPWDIHQEVRSKRERRIRAQALLERVGLNPDHANRYPHMFSGGQRQRIGVARALALNPEIIICDEPVSALDVSVQAQVVNLLEDLQDEFGLSYIFIAHDLSVVRHISDRVAVMYLGKIIETGDEQEVYENPAHPYTQALLSAVPIADPRMRGKRERIILAGDVPSPANPPSGCRFRTRCWKAQDICAEQEPALIPRSRPHADACHFSEVLDVVGARSAPASADGSERPAVGSV
jgi:oligopeptide transport system ATP-binding protein